MNILVTGGAGFIGSNLVDELIKQKHKVYVLDDLSSGNIKNINHKAIFLRGSVNDEKMVGKLMKNIDYVFHLAALVSVPESIKHPDKSYKINVEGTKNIIKYGKINKVRKIIYSSSCAVYGDNNENPEKETSKLKPKSPYAKNKVDAERIIENSGLNYCIFRYFNVYGNRQNPKSQYAAAIPIFMTKSLKNEPIIIYGDGKQTRDFVFVKDIVNANISAMKNKKMQGIYNLGTGKSISINELADKIIKLSKSNSGIIHEKERTGDIKYSSADISKVKKLGFRTKYNVESGLKETLK